MTNPLGNYAPTTSLDGIRMQVYRSLVNLEKKDSMWVQYILDADKEESTESIHQQLQDAKFWSTTPLHRLECQVLPGSGFAAAIGRVLIEYGWVEPDPNPHWMPTLRRYKISYAGRRSLARSKTWYSRLSLLDKIYLSFFE